jgi:hypothetical protein
MCTPMRHVTTLPQIIGIGPVHRHLSRSCHKSAILAPNVHARGRQDTPHRTANNSPSDAMNPLPP